MFAENKKTSVKKKTVGRPDEDLFGDTNDIFGDIPESKPKAAKAKKKKKTTKTAMTEGPKPVETNEPAIVVPSAEG